jgi:apolipoprotein N-acyltransferase
MAARACLHRLSVEPARPRLGLRDAVAAERVVVRRLRARPPEFSRACCPRGRLAASVAALVLVGVAGFGGHVAMAPVNAAEGPLVRIVQPNTPQAEKWLPENRARQLAKLVEMSRREGFDRLSAVVWPETAPPFIVEPGSPALKVMGTAAPPGGYLLTGAARSTGVRGDGVWNSLLVVDPARRDRCALRQGPSRPARRVHPLSPPARAGRRFHWPRLVRGRRGAGDPGSAGPAIGLAGDLLRGDLSRRRHWSGCPAALAAECHQRRLVRPVERPLSAPRQCPDAVDRGRAAHDPCRQHGGLGHNRCLWPVLVSLDMQQEGIIDHPLPMARDITPYGRWGDWVLLVLLAVAAIVLIVSSRFARAENA